MQEKWDVEMHSIFDKTSFRFIRLIFHTAQSKSAAVQTLSFDTNVPMSERDKFRIPHLVLTAQVLGYQLKDLVCTMYVIGYCAL